MEQAERQDASSGATAASVDTPAETRTEGVTRSQHVVYTLPHTVEALTPLLTSALERIDPTQEGVQLIVMTADSETAVAVSDLVYRLSGPQEIEAVPVTSANRAARLLIDRPIHAVIGSPVELQTLLQRSVLKLAEVRTIVLAWADYIIVSGQDNVAALETFFQRAPQRHCPTHRRPPSHRRC